MVFDDIQGSDVVVHDSRHALMPSAIDSLQNVETVGLSPSTAAEVSEVVVQASVPMPLSKTVMQTATQEPLTKTSAQTLAVADLQSSNVATAGYPSLLRNVAVGEAQQNSAASTVAVPISNTQKQTTTSPNSPFTRAELEDLLKHVDDSPFTRAELHDLLKHVDDSPLPFSRRLLAEQQTTPKVLAASASSHPSSDIILAPEIVDIAPLAVLHGDDTSCFAEDNEDFYEEENEFFPPIEPPSRARGKNKKSKAPSDRVLRQRRNQKH